MSVDCDDGDPDIFPGAAERCNGLDDSCEGEVDEGLIGSGRECPGISCLDVLERGEPSGVGDVWLVSAGSDDPYGASCDYGTVGDGWDWRMTVWVANETDDDVEDGVVTVTLDTAGLVADEWLQERGEDLRVFGPAGDVLSYWYAGPVPGEATDVMFRIDGLDAGELAEVTFLMGNPDTERRSISWHYDSFDSDRREEYEVDVGPYWEDAVFEPYTDEGFLGSDETNVDYFLRVTDVEISTPVYVEVDIEAVDDDDGGGPMIQLWDGSYLLWAATDDYNSLDIDGGVEALVWFPELPGDYFESEEVVEFGNLVDLGESARLGMAFHGSSVDVFLNSPAIDFTASVALSGVGLTTLAESLPIGVGLGSLACEGEPGCAYNYLFVGSERLEPAPDAWVSSFVTEAGEVTAF